MGRKKVTEMIKYDDGVIEIYFEQLPVFKGNLKDYPNITIKLINGDITISQKFPRVPVKNIN